MKIYDCFLFFNELDLLEIRLNLLYQHVDYFVIVESEVTFQGQLKDFNFEKNIKRYEKFTDKIFYFKLGKYNIDFRRLPILENPTTDDEILLNKIYKFVEQSNNFDKNHYWGNDNFQRECIWRALALLKPEDSDMIILSDADEIPSSEVLVQIKNEIIANTVYTCKMHEFYYFLNYYHNSDWFGSCAFLYGSFKMHSLNNVRNYRTGNEKSIPAKLFENGGWHFTSLGDTKAIENKIKSWSHKEFNNPIILSGLKYNILHGYDIFRRSNFGKLIYKSADDILLQPLFKNPFKFEHLFGPQIKSETLIKKIFYSIVFKVFLRFYRFLNKI